MPVPDAGQGGIGLSGRQLGAAGAPPTPWGSVRPRDPWVDVGSSAGLGAGAVPPRECLLSLGPVLRAISAACGLLKLVALGQATRSCQLRKLSCEVTVLSAQALGCSQHPGRQGAVPAAPPGTALWSPVAAVLTPTPSVHLLLSHVRRGESQVCGRAGEPGQGTQPCPRDGGCPQHRPLPHRRQPLLPAWSPCPAGEICPRGRITYHLGASHRGAGVAPSARNSWLLPVPSAGLG